MTIQEATTMLDTDQVAQQQLRSTIPARLAYVWRDGSPRVVPMWFHWDGDEFLMGAPPRFQDAVSERVVRQLSGFVAEGTRGNDGSSSR